MFDSATHPINVGTCAHNIFCFGGQVINHKYPKHKEIEGLEKSNVQRNAIYIYYNKVLHRKNIIGQISIILFYYILEIVTCLVSSVFICLTPITIYQKCNCNIHCYSASFLLLTAYVWPLICSGNKPLPGTWDYKAMNLRRY